MDDRQKSDTDEFGRGRMKNRIKNAVENILWWRWTTYLVGGLVIVIVVAVGEVRPPGKARAAGVIATDGKLHVRVFDIGQGDAILIRTPSGDDILVDGGPDDRVVDELSNALPTGDRDIELMVITHPHADHIVGLIEVLNRYDVKRILTAGTTSNTAGFRALEEAIQNEHALVEVAVAGHTIDFGLADLLILHPFANAPPPSDVNDQSVVFLLTHKDARLLFTGDATENVEKELIARASSTLRAAFLKVAHHGSKYSSSAAFLDAVRPTLAAISVGARNRYGHPAYRTIRRLEQAGIKIFRTDQNGDLDFTTDGVSGIMSAL